MKFFKESRFPPLKGVAVERRPRRQTEGKKEFEEKMLEVRRVTRVTT